MKFIHLQSYVACLASALSVLSAARGQSEFGFVNTRSSGQPYLSPEESLRRMQVPEGYEVKLFAAEPDIINPIAFTIDERGGFGSSSVTSIPNAPLPAARRVTESRFWKI